MSLTQNNNLQVDEPEFEDQKAEWWQAFRELHPITSTLEVKLDSHNITPIHFNRKEGLLTFIFDQRGELIIGVDGIIVKVCSSCLVVMVFCLQG